MSPARSTLLIYFAIWCVGIAVAAASFFLLGPDARIPVDMLADGTVTKSRSTAVLWTMPASLTFLYGVLAIGALVESRRRTAPLSADAQRGLEGYGRTMRNVMAAFGLLIIFIQAFTLSRALGVVEPLGLNREGAARAFFVVAGLLFACAGNVTPKLPYVQNSDIDAERHYRAHRFMGWVILLCGLVYSLAALVLPMERFRQAGIVLIGCMTVLPTLRYAYALHSYRRQKRWEEDEGLV